ncbi:type VII toxin-antitoxin system HepT family RNase toxin [Clostridium frigidicarnis]|uniref:Uncharacterized conserved protein YutE, UPF0331/DUF86 family n=1 Tax=Clostridium frigidicarnis TaxID=84698 RepID=A0A1I0VX54_9CLOT|nr:DUF86 domain-containing protein [Clostridium frigidicarnis]SFA81019.1 Uncharacterized conserved protein YutE, UPF0331/DUF86 family [Clostridium frigidicarnis]
MVKREIVILRLDKIDEYIKFLDRVKNYSKNRYVEDPFIYGSSERFLQLTIECVIDIGNHVISDEGYRKPETNREIFTILYENKVINSTLRDNLSNMVSFRNILVHDYLKLDRGIVYDIIVNNLGDIKSFIKYVKKLIV